MFVPYIGDCPAAWQPMDGFLNRVTDGVSESDAFRGIYALYCHDGVVLYVARAYLDQLRADGLDFPFQQIGQSG